MTLNPTGPIGRRILARRPVTLRPCAYCGNTLCERQESR
jgi:hypothetical protein